MQIFNLTKVKVRIDTVCDFLKFRSCGFGLQSPSRIHSFTLIFFIDIAICCRHLYTYTHTTIHTYIHTI